MSKTVTAIFKEPKNAIPAIAELEYAGFTEENFSVLMTDQTRGKSFNIEEGNKAAEGATIGGSLTGLGAAIAAGLAAGGALAIPGLNLVAFGPLVAALTGAGAGAAAGGVVGALIGAGISEHEAKLYEDEVKNGGVLIAVDAQSNELAEKAESIFKLADAEKVAA